MNLPECLLLNTDTIQSLPVMCFSSNVPAETADWLSFDWLFSLLHATEGSGLPLAEHWNNAVPPSFTVNVAGETRTTGNDIDSPVSPFLPGIPAGPISPFSPLVPGSPFNPPGPIIPCLPLFPGDPMIPRSPLFPFLPFGPLRPRVPFVPGGPGGPGGPDEHVTPFEWHRCALHSDKRCLLILMVVSAVSFASVVFLVDITWRLFLWRFWISTNKGNITSVNDVNSIFKSYQAGSKLFLQKLIIK